MQNVNHFYVLIVSNFMFLITSLSTASMNFFKSSGTIFKLATSKSSIFVFKLFKLLGKLTNLAMSKLSTSAFKAIKSFSAKSDASLP